MQNFVLTRREQHNVRETDRRLSMHREKTGHDKEVSHIQGCYKTFKSEIKILNKDTGSSLKEI